MVRELRNKKSQKAPKDTRSFDPGKVPPPKTKKARATDARDFDPGKVPPPRTKKARATDARAFDPGKVPPPRTKRAHAFDPGKVPPPKTKKARATDARDFDPKAAPSNKKRLFGATTAAPSKREAVDALEREAPKGKKRTRPAAQDGLAARRPVEPPIDGGGAFRAGYVALVGRPNVGKSTILNQLLGQKIAATTHKPQTTRRNILGILNPRGAQILLLDTPGFHRPEGPLNRFMVGQSRAAIGDADVIAFVVEARADATITPGNRDLLAILTRVKKPVVLLLNKIDEVTEKKNLLLQAQAYREAIGDLLVTAVPISALKKRGLQAAVTEIGKALPIGEPVFPTDEITDQPERAIVAEFIREKVMLETKDELPYVTAVTIDAFDDQRPKVVRIFATIHVERDSQKGIIIGRGGERLKAIGSRARVDIEHVLGAKVFLDLNVRVTEAWTTSQHGLQLFGYTRELDEEHAE